MKRMKCPDCVKLRQPKPNCEKCCGLGWMDDVREEFQQDVQSRRERERVASHVAWTVRDRDGLNMRCIFSHPRGVMVNYITLMAGVPVRADATEEQIRAAFLVLAPMQEAELVRVSVRVEEVVSAETVAMT